MARPFVGAGSGVQVASLTLTALVGAALTAFADNAALAKLVAPCKMKIIGVSTSVGAVGGTHDTSELDIKVGGNSLLAAPFDVSTAAVTSKEGSGLSTYADAVAKDAEIVVSLAEDSGSSPTWKDVVIQIDYIPVN